MAMAIDFERPWLLLLLPLALLPLLRGGRDTLVFPSIAWLPAGELHVLVMGAQDWGGSAFVTAVGGKTVEVHVPVQRVEQRRR